MRKEKLGMGKNTYTIQKVWNKLSPVPGTIVAASAGSLVAASPYVATTFFPSSGILATVGLGAAAATPIGWVVGAGVLTGGAYLGAKKLFEKFGDKAQGKLPPELLLGLMLPLSLRFAKTGDDQITEELKGKVAHYYTKEWGCSRSLVEEAMKRVGENLDNKPPGDLAESLVGFCNKNENCNRDAIVKSFRKHLVELLEEEGDPSRKEEKTTILDRLEGQFQKLKTTAAGPSQAPQP